MDAILPKTLAEGCFGTVTLMKRLR